MTADEHLERAAEYTRQLDIEKDPYMDAPPSAALVAMESLALRHAIYHSAAAIVEALRGH